VNIRFLTAKLPYSRICGTKVGMSYTKRRLGLFGGLKLALIKMALLILKHQNTLTHGNSVVNWDKTVKTRKDYIKISTNWFSYNLADN